MDFFEFKKQYDYYQARSPGFLQKVSKQSLANQPSEVLDTSQKNKIIKKEKDESSSDEEDMVNHKKQNKKQTLLKAKIQNVMK